MPARRHGRRSLNGRKQELNLRELCLRLNIDLGNLSGIQGPGATVPCHARAGGRPSLQPLRHAGACDMRSQVQNTQAALRDLINPSVSRSGRHAPVLPQLTHPLPILCAAVFADWQRLDTGSNTGYRRFAVRIATKNSKG